MKKNREAGSVLIWISLLFCVFFLPACGPEKRYAVLSTFFDGVPLPDATDDQSRAEESPAEPAGLPGLEEELVPIEKPRPPIENLETWEEVLGDLPKDLFGGPDWVEAIKNGTIAPRVNIDPEASYSPPFTLDTFVRAIAFDEGPPPFNLDIEIVPEAAPYYKVVFPHSSHSLWLNCSSCHPGIVAQRGSGMQKIFAGEYCGKCHGKVSFAVETACARCHANLVPAEKETVEAELAKGLENTEGVSPEILERGKAAYLQACAICHGEQGDGHGSLAAGLDPKPRNFTSGKFKFRSTPSSSPPTDLDLFRTITRGIPGTSMPSFSGFPREDRLALVHFIKTFSDRFTKQEPADPIVIPDPPPLTDELLEMGKMFYREAECYKCHGETGHGDGPSAPELKDDWGEPLRPFNFASGRSPKSGPDLKDYYRDMMTGLQGTPMPDYGDVFEPEQAWATIYYAYSLGEKNRGAGIGVKGDIHFERQFLEQDADYPPATFPHWFHRIRVRCAACHPAVFEMKAGANPITMDGIRAGKFCGKCHPSYPDDKSLAWAVSFDSCMTCHDYKK